MADVLELLTDALSPRATRALADSLGLDEATTAELTAQIVPALIEQLRDNAGGGGAEALAGAVASDHDGSVLSSSVGFLGGGFRSGPGAGILDHVFGDQLDGVTDRLSSATGVPTPVVQLAMRALAPLVLGALAKAAIGAITAVVVVKALDLAMDQIRSGNVQRWASSLNRRLDADGDGSAADDVGRGVVRGVRTGAGAVFVAGRRVASSTAVRRSGKAAAKTAAVAAKGAAKGATKLATGSVKLGNAGSADPPSATCTTSRRRR
ncbi:MAG: DUF937 domain-containing protein [Ilumatobacteraceae bacterium]